MKRSKLSLLLLVPLLFSCAAHKTMDLTVEFLFDEMLINEDGSARLLLNDSEPPQELSDYDITHLVAGDVITISYTGEIYTLESFPSILSFGDAKIKSMQKFDAGVTKVKVVYTEEETFTLVNLSDETIDYTTLSEYYIKDTHFMFASNDDLLDGDELYATYSYKEKNSNHFTLLQLYTFDPYAQ